MKAKKEGTFSVVTEYEVHNEVEDTAKAFS